jgi:hypothetical protein
MKELLSASHFSASSQFLAACLEPSLPPSCHHRMQLETNCENGNVHKKLFKKKNREDLSAAKSMQQEEKKWKRLSDLCGHGQRWKKLREILKCERANLNCSDNNHPRLKQRIINLILTNDQFKAEFIKKTDSNPCYNTQWMDEVLDIECDLLMHTQGLYATEYHYLNVVPNSRVESAHREILSLAIDLACMIIKQLKEISVHRSIIDSMIYAVYTQENFERWDSWFGKYSEYGLYSIFANA